MTRPPSLIDILRNPDTLTAVVASIDAGTRMPATERPGISAAVAAAMVDPDAAWARPRWTHSGPRAGRHGEAYRGAGTPAAGELGQDEALDILHLLSKSGVIDAIGLPRPARLHG